MHLAAPSFRAAAAFYLTALMYDEELRSRSGSRINETSLTAIRLLDVDCTRITGYPKSELRQLSRKMLKRAQSLVHNDRKVSLTFLENKVPIGTLPCRVFGTFNDFQRGKRGF